MNKHLWAKRLRGCVSTTDQSLMTPTEYIVLTMLATWSNSAGYGARPAVATLAEACGTGTRTVQRALVSLIKKGYIEVERKGGGKANPTTYRLVEQPPIPGHLDDTVYDGKPRHSGDTVSANKPRHVDDTVNVRVSDTKGDTRRHQTLTPGDTKGDIAVTPDQVRSGNTSGTTVTRLTHQARARANANADTFSDGTPVPAEPPADPETRGALALVPKLPDRLPNGRHIPKQTRQQMLANLNTTARSQAADQLVRQFETTLDGKLDRRTMFEVAQVIDQLLTDGLDPQQIANGITAWHQSDRLYPSQIPRFVTKAARGTRPTTGKPTAAVLESDRIAAQLHEENER